MAAVQPENQLLDEFFTWVYGGEEGFVYLALKNPETKEWQQRFFPWPSHKDRLVQAVLSNRATQEVYYGPALYGSASAEKPDVKGANVFWVEFDGVVPAEFTSLPRPTLRIMSSEEGHEHWYWRLDTFVESDAIERVNRAITYMFGADASGWDSTQVLRPPGTFNHKRQRETSIIEWHHQVALSPGLFAGLPESPPPVELSSFGNIPDVNDVVFRYEWAPGAMTLFRQGQPVGQRSSGLMALGHICAEMNMTNEEMFSVLLNADERWGKFKDRADRMIRLSEIVTRARQKHPFKPSGSESETPKLQAMGFLSVLRAEVHMEWVWNDLLQRGGYCLVTGPSQVGKTQLSLGAACHMALGQNYLDRKVTGPLKIGFLSLEMNLPDLKFFLMTMAGRYTEAEQQQLEEMLKIFPLGEPLYLNRPEEKRLVEQVIGDLKLDGVVIDSLGSATDEELASENVKHLFDWNDRLRQKTGAFTWFVHHHRKAQSENKKPNKLSDVFGSVYITARATTVLAMWETNTENVVEVIPLKVRLAPRQHRFNAERDGYLHFTRKVSGVTNPIPVQIDGVDVLLEEQEQETTSEQKGIKPAGEWGL